MLRLFRMFRGSGGSRPRRRPTIRVPRIRWRPSPATKRSLVMVAILAILALIVYGTAAFWVNWWWFGSIGYRSVLVTRYLTEAIAFLVAGVGAGAFFFVNLVLALRRSRGHRPPGSRLGIGDRFLLILLAVASAVVLVVAGTEAARHWQTWQLLVNGRDFGVADPIFGHDVGFYVFTLPALTALRTGLTSLVLVTLLGVVVVYAVRLGVRFRAYRRIPGIMRTHVLALGGTLLVLVAVGYVFGNYQLLYSTRGFVNGAGYTDVNAQRWANWALAAISLVTAAIVIVNAFRWRVRWLLGAVAAWVVLAVVVGAGIPGFVQRSVVEPNELAHERPYIAQNIDMTRKAYGLDNVTERDLSGQGALSEAELNAQPATLDNIRLWDYRIAKQTYQQTKSFVPYYAFRDVDIDRYVLNGKIQQVLISARELNTDGLPTKAQTWVNRHLAFTHGYGVVVSPVNEVSSQGLPQYLVDSIPPNGTGPLTISRPEIYFGEGETNWVAVDTKQKEFTGIPNAGSESPTTTYSGEARGSIKLNNYVSRLMVATYLGDRNVLLSGQLTGDSRVILYRDVITRAQKVAPFLTYDKDPYIVVADGHLYWILDAYTSTDRYPDSTSTNGINYLRNTVKVVVDAYNGTMTFYRTATPDPIADAYGAIYGGLFTPINKCPDAIASHFRYPEYLFTTQADVYATYHVTDVTAFYNGDDRWQIAQEQVGGTPQQMEPYYVTMTLPQEQRPDFTLIQPFTPSGQQARQNMSAWMAARTDGNGGPRLVAYRFPRQVTIFGPQQIEARINQEPDISSQVSLWNQSGSTVIHGNLLVIPIGQSVLYVQPLYLAAAQTATALPELKRVIVASNDRVVMRETLPEALDALTSGASATGGPPEAAPPSPAATGNQGATANASLAQQALDAYNAGQAALKAGDWATYGQQQARLQAILQEMAGAGAAPAATPTP